MNKKEIIEYFENNNADISLKLKRLRQLSKDKTKNQLTHISKVYIRALVRKEKWRQIEDFAGEISHITLLNYLEE